MRLPLVDPSPASPGLLHRGEVRLDPGAGDASMTERDGGKVEIQLDHLCNNRCVFCISGRLTHAGKAPLLDREQVLDVIPWARRKGGRHLTFVGGEPTIQPFFVDAVAHALAVGFEEIAISTNGSACGRTDLMERVMALKGKVEWRFSFQGATEEAHERATRRRGSWQQIVEALRRT